MHAGSPPRPWPQLRPAPVFSALPQAIYNLGLVSVRLGELPYALQAFKKLHAMLPDNVEVRGLSCAHLASPSRMHIRSGACRQAPVRALGSVRVRARMPVTSAMPGAMLEVCVWGGRHALA